MVIVCHPVVGIKSIEKSSGQYPAPVKLNASPDPYELI